MRASGRDHRRRAAVHEAGHAVVGRVHGLDCGAVTIVPDRSLGSLGCSVAEGIDEMRARWDRIGRRRGDPRRTVKAQDRFVLDRTISVDRRSRHFLQRPARHLVGNRDVDPRLGRE